VCRPVGRAHRLVVDQAVGDLEGDVALELEGQHLVDPPCCGIWQIHDARDDLIAGHRSVHGVEAGGQARHHRRERGDDLLARRRARRVLDERLLHGVLHREGLLEPRSHHDRPDAPGADVDAAQERHVYSSLQKTSWPPLSALARSATTTA
jgi:hypothetical protein